jgi:hypothetical protein
LPTTHANSTRGIRHQLRIRLAPSRLFDCDHAPVPGGVAADNGQPNKAGRPIETTDADWRVRNQLEKTLIDEISKEYANEKKKKAGTKKLGNNALEKSIQKLGSEHNLEDLQVAEDTIRSRYKRGNLSNVQ